MTRIVIFGANGFIGKHLVNRLALDKDNVIRAFDRFPEYSVGQEIPFENLPNVELFSGNFLNTEDVTESLKDMEYVFHLISTTTPATSAQNPLVDIDTNIRASVELFGLCSNAGIKRVIFPSSGGTVYGDIDSNSINEDATPMPTSPYGIGKLTIEHYLRYFKKTSGLDYIVFRIANPYGPGQNVHGKQGVIPIFMYSCLKKESLSVYGDGSMVRDYIFIDDLIDMIVGTYNKTHNFEIYNIGYGGKGSSINDLIKSIEYCTQKKVKVNKLPVPLTFVHKNVLDTNRFEKEFGIKPKIDLRKGMLRTWVHVNKVK